MNKNFVNKRFVFNVLLSFFIATVVLLCSQSGFLQRLQLSGLDAIYYLRGPITPDEDIVIISIDDRDITRVGRWPWSRDWHAAITKALQDFGARSVYFDIIFSEPAKDGTDELFKEAIKQSGDVFLPFVFQERTLDINKAFFPIEELLPHIKGTGAINVSPDIDGTIRRIPLIFETTSSEEPLPHIALRLAMDYTGYNTIDKDGSDIVLKNGKESLRLPVDQDNKMLINWLGKWENTFYHYSFVDLLNAYRQHLAGEELDLDTEPLKGSVCLVAVTAIGLYDIQSIPIQAEYPGVGILATAMTNIIEGSTIQAVPRWVNFLLIYLLSLVPFLFVSGDKPLKEIVYVLGVGFVFFFIVLGLFRYGILVEYTLPVLSLLISYWGIATFHFIRVAVERQHFFSLAITDGLTGTSNIRYLMMLLKAECLMASADTSKHFCIIMGDIDHFKTFNDTYGHKTGDEVLISLAGILKKCVRSSDVVARYGGEEWIILLRGTSLENGTAVAEKIRATVESTSVHNPYAQDPDQEKLSITISLGVTNFQEKDDESSIVRRADEALYAAKNGGRNRVEAAK